MSILLDWPRKESRRGHASTRRSLTARPCLEPLEIRKLLYSVTPHAGVVIPNVQVETL